MPGPHYALSEALIVIAALWGGWRLARSGALFGVLGVAIFGAAAAVGSLRFGTGRIEELAALHQGVSQIGGATAMALVASQLAMVGWAGRASSAKLVAIVLSTATLVACIASPDLATPLFIVWLVAAIAFAVTLPRHDLPRRLLGGAVVAVFLINLQLVRRSPALGPDLSWHLFHILIAVWIVGVAWIILRENELQKDLTGTS